MSGQGHNLKYVSDAGSSGNGHLPIDDRKDTSMNTTFNGFNTTGFPFGFQTGFDMNTPWCNGFTGSNDTFPGSNNFNGYTGFNGFPWNNQYFTGSQPGYQNFTGFNNWTGMQNWNGFGQNYGYNTPFGQNWNGFGQNYGYNMPHGQNWNTGFFPYGFTGFTPWPFFGFQGNTTGDQKQTTGKMNINQAA
jgi:hypothetical protein